MLSLVFALACFTTAMAEAKENLIYAQSIAITSLDPAGMQPQGYPAGYDHTDEWPLGLGERICI